MNTEVLLPTELFPTLIIDPCLLRAASICQAKSDVRYYLCGIFISKDGEIAATNGHVLFVSKFDIDPESPLDRDIILNIDGSIPAKAKTCELEFIDNKIGFVICKDRNHQIVKRLAFELVDGIYPEYKKITEKVKPETVQKIGINPQYLSLVGKVFPKNIIGDSGTIIEFSGENQAITVTPKNPYYEEFTRLYIMPMRV